MKFNFFFLIVFTCFFLSQARGQNFYTAAAGEIIFSLGNVDAGADPLQNVVRFSPVFNAQQQLHYDFSNTVGIYTGLGIRNVGLITHTEENYTIKERSYSLGIPLALKLGDKKKETNVALGAEIEMMFAWKRKIFVNDQKIKEDDWFSDQVNIFNPSVFAEIKFYKGQYIRFKYYLLDFLDYDHVKNLLIPTVPVATEIPEYGKSSQLFYISFGSVIFRKDPGNEGVKTDEAKRRDDGFFRVTGDGPSESARIFAK